MRFTDTRDDEKERGITIKSTAISMYFAMEKDDVEVIKQKTDGTYFFTARLIFYIYFRCRTRVLDQLD